MCGVLRVVWGCGVGGGMAAVKGRCAGCGAGCGVLCVLIVTGTGVRESGWILRESIVYE